MGIYCCNPLPLTPKMIQSKAVHVRIAKRNMETTRFLDMCDLISSGCVHKGPFINCVTRDGALF